MKIIATNRERLILDNKKEWIIISPLWEPDYINKKKEPNWYLACISKWGYIPIKPVIEVKSIEEITKETYKKAFNSIEWEKDYVT